jgi:AraC-like DNA-binding protein
MAYVSLYILSCRGGGVVRAQALAARPAAEVARDESAALTREELSFDSDLLQPADRVDAYCELYSSGADVEVLGPEFRAAVRMRRLHTLVMFRRRLNDVGHRRDAERVRRTAFDHFTLTLVLDGRLEIDADGRCGVLGPGQIALVDTTRPARNAVHGEILTFSIPRELVAEGRPRAAELHGHVLSAEQAAPLATRMAELWDRAADGVDAAHDVEALRQALQAVLEAGEHQRGAAARDDEAVRRDRVRAIVETNLLSDMPPEQVAASAGLSRATLYRVFEPLGTLTAWRQGRRLWRLRHELASSPETIADAAMASGFEDPSYATARFARTVGVTPSSYRQNLDQVRRSGDPGALLRWVLHNVPVMLSGDVE